VADLSVIVLFLGVGARRYGKISLWSPRAGNHNRGDSNNGIPIQSSYFLDEVSAGIYVIGLLGNHRAFACYSILFRPDAYAWTAFSARFPT